MTYRTFDLRHIVLLCVCCLLVQAAGTHSLLAAPEEPQADAALYVNNQHPQAADDNPGTQDKPLKTIAAAAKKAKSNREKKLATVIRIADGTYREKINLTLGEGSQITFEAINRSKVIISGSDVWGDWKPGAGGIYTHAWPYNWGVEPNPWGDDNIEVPTIVRRREMIFVDGQIMRQVLTGAELATGTFMVEEDKDLVTIRPPEGVDLARAKVEVATRDRLFFGHDGSNLTLRGLTFQHGNEVLDKASVWFIDTRNVLVEDSTFQWNNGVGLKFTKSDNPTVRRSVANYNGFDGMNGDKLRNLLMEDNVTAYNNWRGHWVEFYAWAMGQKFLYVHGGLIRNHQSYGNESRGFWLDTDNSNIVFEGGIVRDNRRDGLFVEANVGPVTVRNSTFVRNGSAGLLVAHSRDVTIASNTMCDNTTAQLRITGTGSSRGVPNWETGEVVDVYTERTTLIGNTLVGDESSQLLFMTPLPSDPWQRFVKTLQADNNRWYNGENAKTLQVTGGKKLDFKGWQSHTGQDGNSTFADPGSIPACEGQPITGAATNRVLLPFVAVSR